MEQSLTWDVKHALPSLLPIQLPNFPRGPIGRASPSEVFGEVRRGPQTHPPSDHTGTPCRPLPRMPPLTARRIPHQWPAQPSRRISRARPHPSVSSKTSAAHAHSCAHRQDCALHGSDSPALRAAHASKDLTHPHHLSHQRAALTAVRRHRVLHSHPLRHQNYSETILPCRACQASWIICSGQTGITAPHCEMACQ